MRSEATVEFIEGAADFSRIVTFGRTTESTVLEFKRDLEGFAATKNDVRLEGMKEICRDIAAFANNIGGCLIVGVDETTRHDGLHVAKAARTLDNVEARKQWIEQAVAKYLVPSTFSKELVSVQLDTGTILVINIPPSRAPVALWDAQNGTIEFLYRTSQGKRFMNPDEALYSMLDRSRAAALAFKRVLAGVEQGRAIDVLPRPYESDGPIRTMGFNVYLGNHRSEHEFELRIPHGKHIQTVNVPFSFLRDAWITSDQRMGIALHTQLVISVHGIELE